MKEKTPACGCPAPVLLVTVSRKGSGVVHNRSDFIRLQRNLGDGKGESAGSCKRSKG